MKIVFIAQAVENLAIEFLSSFLKQEGFEVEIIFDPMVFNNEAIKFQKLAKFFDTSGQLAKMVVEKKPDLVGFSVFTLNYQRALVLSREIKKINPKIPIIFGGIHATCVPEIVIEEKCVDIVCVGEAEFAFVELLESLKTGRLNTSIKNLWFKEGTKVIKNSCHQLITDLDDLPFPDKDLFYDIYPIFVTDDYQTITSRGCPFACTYCANNVLRKVYQGLGVPVRRRSPENVIKELIIAKNKYSPKKITFVDDVFVQDEGWLKLFADKYKKEIGIPYAAITHPRFVTGNVAKSLTESGCFLLMFGIQSASEETRKTILKRFETNDEIRQAAKNCHQNGLVFSIDHIFNIPGEGLAQYEEALKFYNELRPSIVNSFWLQYFPKTEIIKTAVEKKVFSKKMVAKIERGLTSSSVVVGIGNKDTFSPELIYTNFQFIFMLLPFLPKRVMDLIIKRKLYLSKFKPPIIVNVSIKFVTNLFRNRGGVYFSIIRSTFFFAGKNILLKLKNRLWK